MINPLDYKTFLDQSPIGTLLFTDKGDCFDINPSAKRILKLDGHLMASDILNLFDWPIIGDALKSPQTGFTQPPLILESNIHQPSIITKTGKRSHFTVQVYMTRSETLRGCMIQVFDASAASEREKTLKNYERIYNLVVDPVCITDFAGNFVKVNPAFSKIMGYPIDEIEGSPMFNYIHPDDLQTTIDYIGQKILEQPELVSFENRYICKNGNIIWLSWKVQPLYNEQIAFSIARDVTQLKMIEAELRMAKKRAEESDHLKTAFICNMSHEIRTPMNGIIGLSDIISKMELPENDRIKYADIINESCQQLLHIVNDIIDISKIETGQIQLHNIESCINDLIYDLQSFYAASAQKRNLQLMAVVALPNNASHIVCDLTKLRQILDNLINNALKFTASGHIRFGYEKDGNNLKFFVEDTGIGIPNSFKLSIFERFRQADQSTNQNYGGTGLGLSISKAYIEKMGGNIWFDSETNKGTTFYFTLPTNQY